MSKIHRNNELSIAIERLDKLHGSKRDPDSAAVTRKELQGDPLPALRSQLCVGSSVSVAEYNALVSDVYAIARRLSTLDKFNP